MTRYQSVSYEWSKDFCSTLERYFPNQWEIVILQIRSHKLKQNNSPMILKGEPSTEYIFSEHNSKYIINPLSPQNISFFPDMANTRKWLTENAAGMRILNLFAYTCSLSVAAIAGHAKEALNIDLSSWSLSRGRENHRINGYDLSQVIFLSHDIRKSFNKIEKQGPWDIIIFDPPTDQGLSSKVERDYAKVIRQMPEWLDHNCKLIACLNATHLSNNDLKKMVEDVVPNLKLENEIVRHGSFIDKNREGGLKVFIYKNYIEL